MGHQIVATVMHRTDNPDEAVSEAEQVLLHYSDLKHLSSEARLVFWNNLARDLLLLGRAEEAQRYLTQQLALEERADFLILLGQAYQKGGRLEDAERAWIRASEIDPQLGGSWLELGRMALRRHQPEQALTFLEKVRTIAPDYFEILYALERAYRQLNRIEEADQSKERLATLRVGRPSATRGMGSPEGPKIDRRTWTGQCLTPSRLSLDKGHPRR